MPKKKPMYMSAAQFRRCREAMKKSQEQLARDLLCSAQTISRIERAVTPVSYRMAELLRRLVAMHQGAA